MTDPYQIEQNDKRPLVIWTGINTMKTFGCIKDLPIFLPRPYAQGGLL